MAIVKRLQRHERITFKLQPTSVVCRYGIFKPEGGKKIVQLDTYGSDSRKKLGKQSQTLQFRAAQAKALWTLLGKEFNFG